MILRWGDDEWTEADFTVAHVIAVAELVERDAWEVALPLSSPRVTAAWLAVLLAARHRLTLEDALSVVYRAPVRMLADAVAQAARPQERRNEAEGAGDADAFAAVT